jgi:hypothetical protein
VVSPLARRPLTAIPFPRSSPTARASHGGRNKKKGARRSIMDAAAGSSVLSSYPFLRWWWIPKTPARANIKETLAAKRACDGHK